MNTGEPVLQNQLIQENQRLRTAVEELSALNEIATAITSTQTLEQIVDLIVRKCVKHIKVEQGAVMLLDEKDQDKPFHTMIRKQDSLSNILPYRMDAQLTGWMLKNRNPLIVNDLTTDSRFKFMVDKNFPISSLLSVPMMVKGKMIGLLTVFNKKSEAGFTTGDQRLLGIIAAQSAHVIENARLYHEEQSLIRLQEEMRLAYEIQVDLLPKEQPVLPGYQIAGKSIPSKEVGGDYFDFIHSGDNRLAFCLGDISGKGIPAALLMANLQATLRGQTLLGNNSKSCVSFANEMLYQNSAPNKFATLFYGIIDSSKNELSYCNGGHNNPFFFSHDNKLTTLDKGGLIVGIMPSVIYEEDTIPFNSGDLLVIFSDGITEAMNNTEEEFGEQRLIDVILQNKNEPAKDLIEIIIKKVQEFSGIQSQMDDITLVIIKRKD
ncbi:MAG TPA: GAF domain-containing SpoIIE family protein phosphatase [Ignavibacteriaceae bacterium]|jgi:sigma-B regulation protein RsbU (phosphoserine phosphatase)